MARVIFLSAIACGIALGLSGEVLRGQSPPKEVPQPAVPSKAGAKNPAASKPAPAGTDATPLQKEYSWTEVEAALARARANRKMKQSSGDELNATYQSLCSPRFTRSTDYPPHLKQLEAWRAASPDSPAPLVVLGMANVRYAWDARGNGLANTVSEAGWLLFHERIDAAQKLFEQAIEKGAEDGAPYAGLMTVGMAKGLPREQRDAWLAEGRKLDPTYYQMYVAMATSLLPKWGGEPGEVERFAAELADTLGGDNGLEAFARIALTLSDHDRTVLYWNRLDSGKLLASAKVMRERYPRTESLLHFSAAIARASNEQALARELAAKLETADLAIWGTQDRFEDFKLWAHSIQPAAGEKTRLWGSLSGIHSVVFAPNSRYVWCSSGGVIHPMHLIDTQTGQLKQKLPGLGMGVGKFDFSPQQKLVAAEGAWRGGKGIAVWDVSEADAPTLLPIPGRSMSLALSPSEPLLAVHQEDTVRLVDLETGEDRHTLAVAVPLVSQLRFSRDGTLLIAHTDVEVPVWDVKTGQRKYSVRPTDRQPRRAQHIFGLDDRGQLLCLLANGAGQSVARFGADGATPTVLFDATTLESRTVSSLDCKFLAVPVPGSKPKDPQAIEVWSVESKSVVQRLPGHAGYISALAFSQDGKSLASASLYGELKIWELKPEK